MSAFLRELQQVYIEGYRGDMSYHPKMASGQNALIRSNTSYYGLPGSQPGQGNPSMPSVRIPDEAESETVISKSLIEKKVQDLLNQIEEEGLGREARDPLYDILSFIKKN